MTNPMRLSIREKHSDLSKKGCSTFPLRYVLSLPLGNKRLQNGESVFALLLEDIQVIERGTLYSSRHACKSSLLVGIPRLCIATMIRQTIELDTEQTVESPGD